MIGCTSYLLDSEGQYSEVFRIYCGAFTAKFRKCNIEKLMIHFLNDRSINAFVSKSSFKNMSPPSFDVCGNLLPELTRILGFLVLGVEAVYDIVAVRAHNVKFSRKLLTHLNVMALVHGGRCLQTALDLVLDVMFS